MKKAVIFDVDGVMLDSEPLFAAGRESICAEYGLSMPASKNLNGSGIRAFWSDVLSVNGNTALDANALAVKNFDYVLDGIEKYGVTETDGLTALIESLKDEYVLAVGSSSDRYYVERVLKRLNVFDRFAVLVCGDEVKRAKPYGDIYMKALELLGLTADECYVIEDSDNGARSAVNAGIECIGVSLADPPTQKLSECAYRFESLRAVRDFFAARRIA